MGDYTILIPFLAFIAVMCLGGSLLSSRGSRRQEIQNRIAGVRTVDVEKNEFKSNWPLARTLAKLGTMVASKGPSIKLRSQMVRAGFDERGAVAIYLGAKMFLFMVGLVALLPLTTLTAVPFVTRVLMIMGGATVMFFLPNFVVALCSGMRCAEIRRHLPDMVDLLEICVSGGMGLDMAWNAVTDEVRTVCPLLADEMTLTNLETHLGAERGVAVRNMAERTGADELSRLVAVLVQTERFGTSIGDALRVFAKSMRELRSQKAEEKAEEMAVKMLFPMVVFIFPVVLIVAVGPAAITLCEVFKTG
jgi:tight adherence protein C